MSYRSVQLADGVNVLRGVLGAEVRHFEVTVRDCKLSAYLISSISLYISLTNVKEYVKENQAKSRKSSIRRAFSDFRVTYLHD